MDWNTDDVIIGERLSAYFLERQFVDFWTNQVLESRLSSIGSIRRGGQADMDGIEVAEAVGRSMLGA